MQALEQSEELFKSYEKDFLHLLDIWLKDLESTSRKIENHVNTLIREFNSSTDFLNRVSVFNEFNNNINQIINDVNNIFKQHRFNNDYSKLFKKFNDKIEQFDDLIEVEQSKQRFIISAEDSFVVKFLKILKNLLFKIDKTRNSLTNGIKKILKKEFQNDYNWKQKIYFRDLLLYSLREGFSESSILMMDNTLMKISMQYQKLYEIVRTVSEECIEIVSNQSEKNLEVDFNNKFEDIYNTLPQFLAEKKSSLEAKCTEFIETFNSRITKAGTIEFPHNKYNHRILEQLNTKLNNQYRNIMSGWNNNQFSIFDDWRLFEEVSSFAIKNILEFNKLFEECDKKYKAFNDEFIYKFSSLVQSVTERFNGFSGNYEELKKMLIIEKESLFEELHYNLESQAVESLTNKNIPFLADEFERQLNIGIKNLSEERSIVKPEHFNRRIKKSDIVKISPNELLTFSAFPTLVKDLKDIKSKIIQILNNIQNDLLSIDEIADYNLESAISYMNKNSKEQGFDNIIQIATEGLNRALEKLNQISNGANEIKQILNTNLKVSVEKFNLELFELNDTNKLFQKKMNIAKEKALLKSQKYKEDALKIIINLIPHLKLFIIEKYKFVNYKFGYYKKKYGLESPAAQISSEFSDFLSEMEYAKSALPYTYQRLFDNKPINDSRFYQPRSSEIEKLKKSFSNFQKGFYASTVVAAEKGTGVTSLFNMFFDDFDADIKVKRIKMNKRIIDERAFIDFLETFLEIEELKSVSECIEKIISSREQRIVIIENFHFLAAKTISGNQNLLDLFRLISETSKHIYWLLSINIYYWEYLNRTITVSDFFAYTITFEKLKKEDIINLIQKRHRVSGFAIEYEPGSDELKSKKFIKMNVKEKQEYLDAKFYNELNNITKSNISIALLYWMRVAQNNDNNLMKIKSLSDLDFSFMKTLSLHKIHIINAIIVHEKLDILTLSKILRTEKFDLLSILNVMKDDGLIIKDDDFYLVNPFLYRQAVNLLESRNFIH